MSGPTIFWDFDGTLAHRPGRWGGAMMEALDLEAPGHGTVRGDLRGRLETGFPWHEPDVPHPELRDPDAWWARLMPVLRTAFAGVDHGGADLDRLCATTRARYVDPSSYHLFDDTLPVLTALRDRGWRHVVLSNHVPELHAIVDGVGLRDLLDDVISSADTGFEKPHAEAYAIARRAAGHPERRWMVGDNPIADVRGAEANGLPAILVRNRAEGVLRQAADLHEAMRWIDAAMAASADSRSVEGDVEDGG